MDAAERTRKMMQSLDGLSVGDALGERFFGSQRRAREHIARRELPPPRWTYTDDTEMALSIVQVLSWKGEIDPDVLAKQFARRYSPHRGYGPGARKLIEKYRLGASWRDEASELFGGSGSFGNGSAMRVAPLGAFLADDLDVVVENARRQSRVTHTHAEGVAGAIAVAVAAALAVRESEWNPAGYLRAVLEYVPSSEVADSISATLQFDFATPPTVVAETLGSGQQISAMDTVPYCLWCAARHLDSYEEAFWTTVSGLGDRDTTCAIVGGIVGARVAPPDEWLKWRESLPELEA